MINKTYLLDHAKAIGMEKLSIRNLAAAANVSVGTVYNYFPSKKELVAEILNSFWESSLSQDICRVQKDQNFVDYLNILFEKTLMHTYNFKEIMYAQLNFLKEDPGKPNTYYQHMQSGLLKVLEMDPEVDNSLWHENFTREWFIQYILETMMAQLLKREPNFAALELMIRKTLYKGENNA